MDGPLVLGNYVYADGAANVLLASAVDALTVRLAGRAGRRRARVPGHADRRVRRPGRRGRAIRPRLRRPVAGDQARSWPLRALSGGRLLRRAYPPGADPGINDSLVAQQGPNYALAKRVQRWRATVARDGGATCR